MVLDRYISTFAHLATEWFVSVQTTLQSVATMWINGTLRTEVAIAIILIALSILLFVPVTPLCRLIAFPYLYMLRLLRLLGMVHDERTWGVVYDSVSKDPIDPVVVTVRNKLGSVVASAITDLDGRFGIIVSPGTYTMSAQKTNYTFPSARLVGKPTDGYYTALYFGTDIDIGGTERSLAFALPMDPIAIDWNQQEKKRRHLHARDRKAFREAAMLCVVTGGILLVVDYLRFQELQTLSLLQMYTAIMIICLLYTVFAPIDYYHSVVVRGDIHIPLGFARVKIFAASSHVQVASKVTSFNGQFVCLVPNGMYYVTIERRDDNGIYTLVHTSTPFRVVDRAINRQFIT